MLTLEREFYFTKIRHKSEILMMKIMEDYNEVENSKSGINIPQFILVEELKKQASNEVRNLLSQPNGEKLFEHLYEIAWEELKEKLP